MSFSQDHPSERNPRDCNASPAAMQHPSHPRNDSCKLKLRLISADGSAARVAASVAPVSRKAPPQPQTLSAVLSDLNLLRLIPATTLQAPPLPLHWMKELYRVCLSKYQTFLATHPPKFWQAVFQELHAQVASPLVCPHQILAYVSTIHKNSLMSYAPVHAKYMLCTYASEAYGIRMYTSDLVTHFL